MTQNFLKDFFHEINVNLEEKNVFVIHFTFLMHLVVLTNINPEKKTGDKNGVKRRFFMDRADQDLLESILTLLLQ